jgi:hypothetical protein
MLAELADPAPSDSDERYAPALPQSKLNNRVLDNVGPNEPIFVLRAQDEIAPIVIRAWAAIAENRGTPAAKVADARAIADVMEAWPHRKVPD